MRPEHALGLIAHQHVQAAVVVKIGGDGNVGASAPSFFGIRSRLPGKKVIFNQEFLGHKTVVGRGQFADLQKDRVSVFVVALVEIEAIVLIAGFIEQHGVFIGGPRPILTILHEVQVEPVVAVGVEGQQAGPAILAKLIRPAHRVVVEGVHFAKGARRLQRRKAFLV